MQNGFYHPCTAYCALSASDNSRVGVATHLHVTNWFCITNQYNHKKNHFAHLLSWEDGCLIGCYFCGKGVSFCRKLNTPFEPTHEGRWADSNRVLSLLTERVESTRCESWVWPERKMSLAVEEMDLESIAWLLAGRDTCAFCLCTFVPSMRNLLAKCK